MKENEGKRNITSHLNVPLKDVLDTPVFHICTMKLWDKGDTSYGEEHTDHSSELVKFWLEV